MRKSLALFTVLIFLSSTASAFLYEIKTLTRAEVQKLSDEDLMEAYIQAKIEEKASGEFHVAAGFSSAKDYTKRKELLRFLFELRYEMSKRKKVEADSIDESLK